MNAPNWVHFFLLFIHRQRIEIRCYDMGRPDGTMTSCERAHIL